MAVAGQSGRPAHAPVACYRRQKPYTQAADAAIKKQARVNPRNAARASPRRKKMEILCTLAVCCGVFHPPSAIERQRRNTS